MSCDYSLASVLDYERYLNLVTICEEAFTGAKYFDKQPMFVSSSGTIERLRKCKSHVKEGWGSFGLERDEWGGGVTDSCCKLIVFFLPSDCMSNSIRFFLKFSDEFDCFPHAM